VDTCCGVRRGNSQSIKTSATVPLTSQGVAPAKKIIGRKRHIVTDTLGLLLAVTVTAASVHDSAAGTHLLADIAARHPTITKAWADNGYKTKAVEHAAHLGIDLEIVQRDPTTRGFHVQPRRWVIERILGWLMHHRRLARDYETHPHEVIGLGRGSCRMAKSSRMRTSGPPRPEAGTSAARQPAGSRSRPRSACARSR
jgi:transposase